MSNITYIDENRTAKRYAILYSGTGDLCTLNDLEYCYRLLAGPYQFKKPDIFVYYYNGNPESNDPANPATYWPDATTGDNYTLAINGGGTAKNFHDACESLASVVQPQDLVFIHTNGHGGYDDELGPYLLTNGTGGKEYYADQFFVDLGLLPQHASMLIVMQQCNGGCFVETLQKARNSIHADLLSFASASIGVAHVNDYRDFSHFTEAWLNAHFDKDPFGQALSKKVKRIKSGFVEAREAYNYAKGIADDFGDTPATRNSPGESRDISLA
jgi:hypothetical protein